MAIAFGTAANNGSSGTSPVTVTVTINNGDTGVAVISLTARNTTPDAVTSLTGGGTWALRVALTVGLERVEVWSTAAGAATAASSVDVAFGTTDLDAVCCFVGTWTGALGLGVTGTASGSTANPSITTTTQDNNNWVIAGFACLEGGVPTVNTANLRSARHQPGAVNHNGSGAMTDQTAVSPGSVVNDCIQTANSWVAAALELRTVAGGAPPVRPVIFVPI